MRRLQLVALLGCLFFFAVSANAAESGVPELGKPDPVIAAARAKLYTARPESIFLLEEAILQSPQRTDYWIELLRALETDSASPFVLACYAQAARQANPNSLELHWEWIRLLSLPAGLEELDVLAKREQDLKRVNDARSVLTLGMKLPLDWSEGNFLEQWAARLVRAQQWDRAKDVIATGLQKFPQSKTLRICEALELVHRDKFEEATACVEKLDYVQNFEINGLSKYPNVSDALLLKKQPKFAVRAYGTHPDAKLIAGRDGLILGQALLLNNEPDRAEHIFEKTETDGAHLLVIANLLELKKEDEAHAVAQELINAWPAFRGRGEMFSPRVRTDLANASKWPVSLQPELSKAITWLYAEYPKRKAQLAQYIPEKPFAEQREYPFVKPFLAQRQEMIEQKAPASELAGHAYSYGLNFELAARDSREYLVNPAARVERYDPNIPRIVLPQNEDGISNEMLLNMSHSYRLNELRAASLTYYRTHLPELIAARQLLENLKATRWNPPKIKGQAWLSDEEVVARAAKLDAQILPMVLEGLEPHTISGQDRTPWVQIIAKLGNQADVPALLLTMSLIAKDHERSPRVPIDQKMNRTHDQVTLDALNSALEQLTGEKCKSQDAPARVEFWQDWWRENYERVISQKR